MKATTTLTRFLKAWENQDRKGMIRQTQLSYLNMKKEMKHIIYDGVQPINFSDIEEVSNDGVKADILCVIDGLKYTIRLIKESAPYKPDLKGKWGVNPASIRKV